MVNVCVALCSADCFKAVFIFQNFQTHSGDHCYKNELPQQLLKFLASLYLEEQGSEQVWTECEGSSALLAYVSVGCWCVIVAERQVRSLLPMKYTCKKPVRLRRDQMVPCTASVYCSSGVSLWIVAYGAPTQSREQPVFTVARCEFGNSQDMARCICIILQNSSIWCCGLT